MGLRLMDIRELFPEKVKEVKQKLLEPSGRDIPEITEQLNFRSPHYNRVKLYVAEKRLFRCGVKDWLKGEWVETCEYIPSSRYIANYLSIPQSSVSRAILNLEDEGWLEREGRYGKGIKYRIKVDRKTAKNFKFLCGLPYRERKKIFKERGSNSVVGYRVTQSFQASSK